MDAPASFFLIVQRHRIWPFVQMEPTSLRIALKGDPSFAYPGLPAGHATVGEVEGNERVVFT